MRPTLGAFLAAVVLRAAGADIAVIVNSGSTNTPGFRIGVERSGEAEYSSTPRGQAAERLHRKVPDALLQRFYADLQAAQPLSALAAEHCAKSVSFGTRTTVELGGEQTPDISCPNARNAKTKALMRDVGEIVALFRSD